MFLAFVRENSDELLTENIMKNQFDSGDKILHKKFVLYGANAKEWMRKCVLLLPEIDRRKIWRKKRFGSIYEYAAKIAGMSREKVNESLRIFAKVEDKPALMRVIEEKGISAVRPVATIVTSETSEFWADKSKNMSVNELETYVRDFKRQGLQVQASKTGNFQESDFAVQGFRSGGLHMKESEPVKCKKVEVDDGKVKKIEIKMVLDPEIAYELEKLKGFGGDWNQLMKEFLVLRKQVGENSLEEQKSEKVNTDSDNSLKLENCKPEKIETESRHIPVSIQRYVIAKTGGLCAFPGCNKKAVNFHHTQRFALEQVHDPDRIVGLCEAHHSIAHRGLIKDEELAPVFWRVREEADWSSGAKFWVDRKVGEYRNFG